MKKTIIKRLRVSVLSALILAVVISCVDFNVHCDDLKNNVLRLHIIANSDSDDDQNLKLLVRDAVLKVSTVKFESCTDINSALIAANSSLDEFCNVAKQVISENGYDYPVTAELKKTYFNTRIYDDYTLPAGYYDALQIKIGKAEGHNWWCVMFPAICVPAASRKNFKATVGNKTTSIITNSSKYQIRFKTVEVFEQIKKIIGKR